MNKYITFTYLLSRILLKLNKSRSPVDVLKKRNCHVVKRMKKETEIEAIPFKCILLKSPDVCSMDYCAFGLLTHYRLTLRFRNITDTCNPAFRRNFIIF